MAKKTVKKKAVTRKKSAIKRANRAPASKRTSTKAKVTSKKPASAKKAVKAKKSATPPKAKATAVARQKIARKASAKTDPAALISNPDYEPPTQQQLRKVKTGLTKRELEHYRQLLLEKRAEILGDVASLQMDARNGAGANISYEHMADTGSDNYEQEFTLGLVASEQKMLSEINDALLRMRSGCYGVCIETGVPIGKPRLDAKPWARYCIEVAREKERRGQN